MPAEWDSQEAVILSWPHNQGTWPFQMGKVIQTYLKIIDEISEVQDVWLLLSSDEMRVQVESLFRQYKIKSDRLKIFAVPTCDVWARDYGPIYVVKEEDGIKQRVMTNWEFNAWGDKYDPDFLNDNFVNEKLARFTQDKISNVSFILEGGSIDVNGKGTLITTEDCLLHPNRAHASKKDVEQMMQDFLGVTKVLWIEAFLKGDDTDGHVDNVVRFVDPHTLVLAFEDDANDVNHQSLKMIHQSLQSMTDQDGKRLQVIKLPMPDKVVTQGIRLPASYANFLIVNEKVLVPTYRSVLKDERALKILQGAFPKRRIIGIDATDLVYGLGSIHCISQQVPCIHPI